MAQDIAKKVTLNKLGVEKDWILEVIRRRLEEDPKNESPIEVAAFVGMISGVKPKNTDYGDYMLFEGDFKGVNMLTGTALDAAAMIVPSVAETPLVGMFKRAAKVDEDGNILSQGIVEFAFTITVRKDKAAIGYAYGVRNHVATGPNMPILRLLKMIPFTPAVMKMLPAMDDAEGGEVAVAAITSGDAGKGRKR